MVLLGRICMTLTLLFLFFIGISAIFQGYFRQKRRWTRREK